MILTLFFKGCIGVDNLTMKKNVVTNKFFFLLDCTKRIKTVP